MKRCKLCCLETEADFPKCPYCGQPLYEETPDKFIEYEVIRELSRIEKVVFSSRGLVILGIIFLVLNFIFNYFSLVSLFSSIACFFILRKDIKDNNIDAIKVFKWSIGVFLLSSMETIIDLIELFVNKG